MFGYDMNTIYAVAGLFAFALAWVVIENTLKKYPLGTWLPKRAEPTPPPLPVKATKKQVIDALILAHTYCTERACHDGALAAKDALVHVLEHADDA